jgi:hypothetical protein
VTVCGEKVFLVWGDEYGLDHGVGNLGEFFRRRSVFRQTW